MGGTASERCTSCANPISRPEGRARDAAGALRLLETTQTVLQCIPAEKRFASDVRNNEFARRLPDGQDRTGDAAGRLAAALQEADKSGSSALSLLRDIPRTLGNYPHSAYGFDALPRIGSVNSK